MKLTYEYLHEILSYDPLTGALTNKVDRHKAKAGFVHQAQNSGGYIVIRLAGKLRRAQDVIWCMMTGEWPDLTVDHKDHVPTNNRWENLRLATKSQNMANRSVGKNNVLGVKGVTQVGKRFRAHIRIGGDYLHLGHYDTAAEAGEAYREAAEIAFGEFAYSS